MTVGSDVRLRTLWKTEKVFLQTNESDALSIKNERLLIFGEESAGV